METACQHIDELERKITDLAEAQARLVAGPELKELLRIIRFPGWTTPAELGFVHATLNGMLAHTVLMQRMQEELLVNSKKVVPRS